MKVKLLIVLCILKLSSCDLEYSLKGVYWHIFTWENIRTLSHFNTNVDISPRIVGGSPAYDGQAPYQCSVQKIRTGSHFCGCAIISDRWVVTAGHCIVFSANDIQIRVGSHKKSSGGQVLKVLETIRHPEYKEDVHLTRNDIGLIRVQGSIEFNKKVQPINYDGAEPSPGTQLLATGWGMLNFPGDSPEDLQQLKIKAISCEECQKTWPGIDASVLCTS
ncbi:chymotrypsin-1-like, partial [Sitodiplosis mosellana]|uniref:chymotrypsin-1-like n=1 Tax=Sitodiplosis mosellana TaxID=263140 RepID=UPI00244430E6